MSAVDLTLADALDRLAKKDMSAVELAEAHLEQMAQHRSLNAYLVETPERALNEARASDERRARGDARPLDGIPLGIKDLFCTKGVETTAVRRSSKASCPPTNRPSPPSLARRCGDAGQAEHGRVRDGLVEHDQRLRAGRKSVAPSGLERKAGSRRFVGWFGLGCRSAHALGATGTDTGGSIRQPAAFCGIVGIKPTYGRCSRWGTIAFASSLDQAGPFARTVKDTAILLRSMAGFDPKDSTSVDMPVPDWVKDCVGNVKGMRIGIPRQYRMDGMPAEIDRVWEPGCAVAARGRR